jgi:signal transduction histidine kinase
LASPPDQQEHVFERFYQVKRSGGQRYSGVGLGLALVKEVTEAYGGRVSVRSQIDEGSAFAVSLPLYRECETC